MTSVIAVPKSGNRKTGRIAATYASQATCPSVCPLRGAGCYAESGPMAITTRRLNGAGEDALDIARHEAELIDTLPGDRKLRVHVVGDCPSAESAGLVGAAMVRYQERSGFQAWTYTHAWRTVPASAWQGAEVLASVEHPEQIAQAETQGYASAIVVSEHPGRKVYQRGTANVVPCPQQFGTGTNCETCGLCQNGAVLRRRGLTVGFAAHGSKARSVKARVGA